MHKSPFPKNNAKGAMEVLVLIHTDVCGKMGVESLSGCEYFVTFIDDKSRYLWTFSLKKKSDVYSKFIEWKASVEKQSGKVIKKIRSDNGGEYTSDEFLEHLKEEGIHREFTIPDTPEQNGVAERMNRTLIEVVRSLLSESDLPQSFWAEALSTATYLRNLSPTVAVNGMTPFEAWMGYKPSVSHLRVFGCVCYAHIPKDKRKKLDSKAREAIFLGYGKDKKGYRLFDPSCSKIFYSRDVKFNESQFKLKKERKISDSAVPEEERFAKDSTTDDQIESDVSDRAPRIRNPPNHYGEWTNVTMTENEISEPKTYKQAINSDESEKWVAAMSDEIDSLNQYSVWELVKLPEGRKAIGCKWVFKVKMDADGNVNRFKARLVAQGFNQRHGVDYDETFSPVVRFESVRSVIALAAQHGLQLHQMDVKTAFLNGELQEEIYMRQPAGFQAQGKENHVCLLKRSLYGLKQSARCWNTELDATLKEMNFSQSTYDPCIYIKYSGGEIFIIAVYVDDIILAGEEIKSVQGVKKAIAGRFKVEDMGKLHYFLGVKIVQSPGSIWIGQPNYCSELLKRFRMENSRPVSTPCDAGVKLQKAKDEDELCKQDQYQSAVGSLLYLSTKTRPDLAYAVANVSKYCAKPTQLHWVAVKRIMRYLNGSLMLGLHYSNNAEEGKELIGYSDADWAGDLDDRKSTSGFIFSLSGGAVSWRSKKQTCVALSTAEAEYIALAAAFQEAVWLRRLLSEMGECCTNPTTVFEDNQSAMCIAKNQHCHGKTKHVDIKYHFVREQTSSGDFELKYCNTDDMKADMFTKSLCGPKFTKFRSMIGMKESTDRA